MTSKKWIGAAVALLVVIAGAWRWLGHSATEADDDNHPVTGSAVIAAVARVERGPMDSMLIYRGTGPGRTAKDRSRHRRYGCPISVSFNPSATRLHRGRTEVRNGELRKHRSTRAMDSGGRLLAFISVLNS